MITVSAGYHVLAERNAPDSERAEAWVSWKAINARHVLVFDGSDTRELPTEGKLSRGGQFVFTAVADAASATACIGASVTAKPGTGLNGIVYNFTEKFDPEELFRLALKREAAPPKTDKDIIAALAALLQQRNYYISEASDGSGGTIIHTINYFPDQKLTAAMLTAYPKGGERRWQIAYAAHVKYNNNILLVKVLPNVRINFPRDNDTWAGDPNAIDVALPFAREILAEILR